MNLDRVTMEDTISDGVKKDAILDLVCDKETKLWTVLLRDRNRETWFTKSGIASEEEVNIIVEAQCAEHGYKVIRSFTSK